MTERSDPNVQSIYYLGSFSRTALTFLFLTLHIDLSIWFIHLELTCILFSLHNWNQTNCRILKYRGSNKIQKRMDNCWAKSRDLFHFTTFTSEDSQTCYILSFDSFLFRFRCKSEWINQADRIMALPQAGNQHIQIWDDITTSW